jgi:hypothetical protein
MSTRLTRRVVAKTADYTIVYPMDAPGTIFTNNGATGAVIFTLPTASKALLGVEYLFKTVVDYDVTVKPPAVDTALSLNDLTADSLAASTSSQKIGAEMKAVCVPTAAGYSWALSGVAVGHTYTLAT